MDKKKIPHKKYLIIGGLIIIVGVLFFFYQSTSSSTNAINGSSSNFLSNVFEKEAVCGNGELEEGETSQNCCLDAGCPTGYSCQEEACVELRPDIEISFTQESSYSSTILLSSKNKNTIGKIQLENVGNDIAKNIEIVITSPQDNFDEFSTNLEKIDKEESTSINLGLDFNENVLSLPDESDISLNIEIKYVNSVNNQYKSEDTSSFTVYGKNSMVGGNFYNSYSAWITPRQNIIREFAAKSTSGIGAGWEGSTSTDKDLAARWLFESLKNYGVDYVNDIPSTGDYVQFPYETLKRRNGDCEDLAVLYASLLESIGMESRIIIIPGHAFAGYIDREGYLVPIETTESSFESALDAGRSQYNENQEDMILINPREGWRDYQEITISNEPSIPLPDIQKQSGECELSFTFSQGVIAKAPITFHNAGSAAGAGCAAILTYNSQKEPLDDDLSCWPVNPGETKSFDYTADIGVGDLFSGYYCIVY